MTVPAPKKAPVCRCGHLLVAHGAGRCAWPECTCPSTPELWAEAIEKSA